MRASACVLRWPQAEMVLGGQRIRYAVRCSRRARHASLWIAPGTGLVVTTPPDCPAPAIRALLRTHRRWIHRHLPWLQRRAALPPRWPYGKAILYRGEDHRVLVAQGRPPAVLRMSGRVLMVRMPRPGIDGARRALRRWLSAEAVRAFEEQAAAVGARMRLAPRRIYVRPLRRRWGACWPGGSLSFNDRLIMAPPRVLEYVVVHELAHLQEPNHSPRFWSLVARHDPAYQAARRWLRVFGPALAI